MKITSKNNLISEAFWIKIVNNNEFLVPLHKFYNSKNEVYNAAVFMYNGTPYGRIRWNWDTFDCSIEIERKYLPQVYKGLLNVAANLDGQFYMRKNELFDPKKHLPIPSVNIVREKQYFKADNLKDIRWLAMREGELTSVLKKMNLQVKENGKLEDLSFDNNLIITPSFEGWIFIIGENLPNLLTKGDETSSEEALTNLCKSIQKLSKSFVEVQYFEYSEKSSVNGYFKANNGKLIFGFWKSELEEFKKGKLPKEIKKIHPTNAHEVSSIWSIDPMDFVFIEKFAKEKSMSVVLL